MSTIPAPDTSDRLSETYIRGVFKSGILSKEDEVDLMRQWCVHRDRRALNRIIEAHARLSVSIATKYKRYGLPIKDLVQEGNLGLMHAAHRFDPDKKVRFSTYAMFWIRAQIQQYLLDNWSQVKFVTTNDRKKLFFHLSAVRNKLGIDPFINMSEEEIVGIARDLNVQVRDVMLMSERMSGRDSSLNDMLPNSGAQEFVDVLVDERPTPEQNTQATIDLEKLKAILGDALSRLTERERRIIIARQMKDTPDTLEALSLEFGVSRERVRQIERKGLDRLKGLLGQHFNLRDLLPAG